MSDVNIIEKNDLRERLKAKIEDKCMARSSKKVKETVLNKTLKHFGIEKDKLKADLDAVKKQGGLEIKLKQ
jgi:hypothetical protein